MKWFITLLFIILATAVAFVLLSLKDPGFIVIGRGAWTLETSLSVFILALILAWLVVVILIRLLRILWRLPLRLFYNQQKADESLVRGMLALIQEQWRNAEQTFLRTISPGELSALHYVGAAYAAYQQQAPARAAEYFSNAQNSLPKETVALILFEAKLQLQQHDLPAALEKTREARQLAPKHEGGLLLLLTLYMQLADWQALLELLSEVRKRKALPPEQIQRLENRASIALINHTLRASPLQATKIWAQIPKMMRLRPAVLKVYVKHLIAAGDATTAEPLVREAMKYQWDTDLVTLYGALETSHTSQQISYAEGWLKNHGKDPALLQTLGYLCLRNRLWDQAQKYLDESVYLAQSPKTYQLLGELLTQKGKLTQATEYYRQGLQLAIEER